MRKVNDWIAANAISILGSVVSAGVVYGMQKAKGRETELRLTNAEVEIKSFMTTYVTQKHFDTIVQLLQKGQDEMQRDIKRILEILAQR